MSQTTRRQILQAGAVALPLPWLESQEASSPRGGKSGGKTKRFIAACYSLSFMAANFWPDKPGKKYTPSRYLKQLGDMSSKSTVISGLAHEGSPGGHGSETTWLTGSKRKDSKINISLDQLLAENLGHNTRFASLVMSNGGPRNISYSRSGTPILPTSKAGAIFDKMFGKSSGSSAEAELKQMRTERSLLDAILGQAKSMKSRISRDDQKRLDSYLEAVRQAEKNIAKAEAWLKKPKPKAPVSRPSEVKSKSDVHGKTKLFYDMARLAMQSDSSRIMSILSFGGSAPPAVEGVSQGHHPLSHHITVKTARKWSN